MDGGGEAWGSARLALLPAGTLADLATPGTRRQGRGEQQAGAPIAPASSGGAMESRRTSARTADQASRQDSSRRVSSALQAEFSIVKVESDGRPMLRNSSQNVVCRDSSQTR